MRLVANVALAPPASTTDLPSLCSILRALCRSPLAPHRHIGSIPRMTNRTNNKDPNNSMIPTWIDGQLRPYEKLAAHREGLQHKAVSVFVMAGNAVLMQRRALGKYHTPGLWANTCCTHPDWNESNIACSQRRLQQELGITGLAPMYRGEVRYHADVGGGLIENEVVAVFIAPAPRDLEIHPNPDEVMDVAWMDYDELFKDVTARPEIYTPWLRIYLADHRAMIFGSNADFFGPERPENG